jgi:hypothetical protein
MGKPEITSKGETEKAPNPKLQHLEKFQALDSTLNTARQRGESQSQLLRNEKLTYGNPLVHFTAHANG